MYNCRSISVYAPGPFINFNSFVIYDNSQHQTVDGSVRISCDILCFSRTSGRVFETYINLTIPKHGHEQNTYLPRQPFDLWHNVNLPRENKYVQACKYRRLFKLSMRLGKQETCTYLLTHNYALIALIRRLLLCTRIYFTTMYNVIHNKHKFIYVIKFIFIGSIFFIRYRDLKNSHIQITFYKYWIFVLFFSSVLLP